MGKNLPLLFWMDGSHYLHQLGFRRFYARSSNVKSYALLTKNGAEMTTKVKALENGKVLTLSFVKWEFAPITFRNSVVLPILAKSNL